MSGFSGGIAVLAMEDLEPEEAPRWSEVRDQALLAERVRQRSVTFAGWRSGSVTS